MAWTTNERVMRIRRRSYPVDLAVETLDGWRRHLSGRNASLVAFFTFLSLFPLMLAAAMILGIVLEGDPDLRDRILEGAASEIPVIGAELRDNPDALNGSIWVVAAGLLGALWSSTKAFVGLQGALDDVWEVPVDDRAGMPVQRGRALVGLLILGAAQIGSIVLGSIAAASNFPVVSEVLLVLATVALNIVVLAAMYRFLTSASPSWSDVWPGAVTAGVAFSLLQYFGPRIVTYITDNAGDTYGTFAIVLGLITWLSLIAISALMSAELNAARVRLRDRLPEPTMGPDFDLPIATLTSGARHQM